MTIIVDVILNAFRSGAYHVDGCWVGDYLSFDPRELKLAGDGKKNWERSKQA